MSLIMTVFGTTSRRIRPAMKAEDLKEKLKLADPNGDVYIKGVYCNSAMHLDYDVKIDLNGDVIFDIGGFPSDFDEE